MQLDSERIWILGGEDGNNYLDTTEFIQLNETVGILGPKLPYAINATCAVKVSEDKIFVIGGDIGGELSNFVWIFNPNDEFSYKEGPKLKYARWSHQCGFMKDEIHYHLVVAGGRGIDGKTTSVEILDLTSFEWSSGMQNELSRGSRKETLWITRHFLNFFSLEILSNFQTF